MIVLIIGTAVKIFSKLYAFIFRPMATRNYMVFFIVSISFSLIACSTEQSTRTSSTKELLQKINGEPIVPRDAVTIDVSEFDDFTKNFLFTNKLTLKIREFITIDGRLAVVGENGDLTLKGSIEKFQIQPLVFTTQGIPVKKRILIISKVSLVDSKNKKIIFQNQPIQSFVEYSDQIPPIISEIQAIDQAIYKLAERIQVQTIHGWHTSLMTPVEKGK